MSEVGQFRRANSTAPASCFPLLMFFPLLSFVLVSQPNLAIGASQSCAALKALRLQTSPSDQASSDVKGIYRPEAMRARMSNVWLTRRWATIQNLTDPLLWHRISTVNSPH